MSSKKDWFVSWFNTKYYHILYQNRDYREAQLFIDNLLLYLDLPLDSHIIDLACGKGRHSVYLNKKGFKVTGLDLSVESIKQANQFKNNKLSFYVHDMRIPFPVEAKIVFNMFTSFGYFYEDSEDIQVLDNINKAIQKDGVAVIDYLNINKITNNLVSEEVVERGALKFHIKREIKEGFLFKNIVFDAEGKTHNFTERVKCLDQNKLLDYCKRANLKVKKTFGDYMLNPYDSKTSDRLILILTK